MDEDTAALLVLGGLFLTILSTPFLITACVAASSTRKWAAERRRSVKLPLTSKSTSDEESAEGFLTQSEDSDDESDTEFLDEEDERYYNAKRERKQLEREERKKDLQMSARSKFLKEWKKCWVGQGGSVDERKKEQEFKEEESRRKIAREAVREYLRVQRKQERKAAKASLPTYAKEE